MRLSPGMAGFDDPAPRPPAGSTELALDLLAAAADVGREAAPAGEFVHPGVVVAAVEAQPLRPFGARLWPFDRDRVEARF